MANTTDNGNKHDVRMTYVFEAPVEQVWKAWSDPQFLLRLNGQYYIATL
jgi:uncharacterized protein YndB with AHSA1/START domain